MKLSPLSYSRHAEDSGVEIQGFNRIFNSQHSLLHHEILQHRNPITKLYIYTLHTQVVSSTRKQSQRIHIQEKKQQF